MTCNKCSCTYCASICITRAWTVPDCDAQAILKTWGLFGVQEGSYLWSNTYGYFLVISFDASSGELTVQNVCLEGNAEPGTMVAACTKFALVSPPGGSGIVLANDVYLRSRNAENDGYLDLLKGDTDNNTVLNASDTNNIVIQTEDGRTEFWTNGILRWAVDNVGNLTFFGADVDPGEDSTSWIRASTTLPGTHNKRLNLSGGGLDAAYQGAMVDLAGNDCLNGPGWAEMMTGDAPGASIYIGSRSTTGEVKLFAGNLDFLKLTAAGTLLLDPVNGTRLIAIGTTNGADTKKLDLSSGAIMDPTRGARLSLRGNEFPSTGGYAVLASGDVSGAGVLVDVNSSNGSFSVENATDVMWSIPAATGVLTQGIQGGNLSFTKATGNIELKSGANGRTGTFTMNGSTPVVISNTSLVAGDLITITADTPGGTPGPWALTSRTNATGFSVTGTAGDTSGMRYTLTKIN